VLGERVVLAIELVHDNRCVVLLLLLPLPLLLLLLLLSPGELEDAIIDVDVPNARNTEEPGGLTIQVRLSLH
jgi:hypothetical protein